MALQAEADAKRLALAQRQMRELACPKWFESVT